MGRRVTKNGQRFVYDGYLQIANFEHQTSNIKLQTFIWDPTEPIATRPLVWNSSTFQPFNFSTSYYTHDGNKNVSEVVASGGDVSAHYEYAPFGAVIAQRGAFAADNPWRFSSEFADDDTATVYYNYRHYESSLGRWQARDPTKNDEISDLNLYVYCANSGILNTDELGLKIHFDESSTPQDITKKHKNRGYTIHNPISLQLKCSFWGRLTVNGIATRKIFLKPENDPIWAKRYKRYDVWGSPRTNAEERNCTLKHEMDHYQSYNDLFSFLHTIDALDGTNQGFLCCKKKKEELEIKYRYLYSQAVMKSASYDSAGKNQGGVYPK